MGFLDELSGNVRCQMTAEIAGYSKYEIEEIHIKRCGCGFIKCRSGIRMLRNTVSSAEFDEILSFLTGGSLYAHSDSIERGYISYSGGIRAGVSGEAVSEKGKLLAVSGIDSLNIRIPRLIRGICDPVISALAHTGYRRGILICSPPGVGKTTLLRDTALTLSSFPYYRRVSLIDTRGEFSVVSENAPTLDVYKGYPPAVAVEAALRTMSPEIIICDEIGGDEELKALLTLCGKGICLLAGAHGGSFDDIYSDKKIRELIDSRLFAYICTLKRKNNNLGFDFRPVTGEE